MSLSTTTDSAGTNIVRLKRQLDEQAIAAATAAEWTEAGDINARILELGPDSEAENRLAKALWELGELAEAREHYQAALAIDPTNRIAERNINRLRMLLAEAGKKTVAGQAGQQGARLDLRRGDRQDRLRAPDRSRRAARSWRRSTPATRSSWCRTGRASRPPPTACAIGFVEPRVAARLLKLIADGNKYAAGVTSLGDKDVRIIIRETYQDPANYGKVSFPTAAKVSDLRPYTKGTLVREEMDLEEELELDEEDDEIEDIGSCCLPT